MKKTIIANWKMNSSFDEAKVWVENIIKKIDHKNIDDLPEIVLCPPSVMIDFIDDLLLEKEFEEIEKLHKTIDDIPEGELEKLVENLRYIKLGSQDCHHEEEGAFTGDISAKMIKDCGGDYTILGHSERRSRHAESSELVAKKVKAAVKAELAPIICVGESKEQRDCGEHKEFIKNQLKDSLPKDVKISELIIAYEPIWSIGSGLTPSIAQIEEMIALIKAELEVNDNIDEFEIVYGGSANAFNAAEILKGKNVDGLLVGGASLKDDEFFKIIQSA
ncbi:MAG: triosephosphate isomerase [Lentimonas sp.]|jgi:triosephosphate isomerase